MKVNVNTEIKDLNGEVIVEGKDKTPLLVKPILINALTILSQEDKDLDGKERYDRYTIALKISDAEDGMVSLKSEEVAKIKELVGAMYQPLVVGRVYDALEGTE